jgi:hypothetical protein
VSAVPTEPRRLCHVWQANRQKNQPFPNSKKKFGGGKFKKCKGWFFLAGCVLALPKQAAGLGSHFALETGSSFVVKLSQLHF